MKNFFIVSLAVLMLAGGYVLPVHAADEVCGVDGTTYAGEQAALDAGVEISYEGVCEVVTNESSLDEETQAVNFAGVLIEIGTTEIPTTIIVEDNITKTHYTVEVTASTYLNSDLSDWIPGDQVRVAGMLNENTETVAADRLSNLSYVQSQYDGINGWISALDEAAGTLTYTWNNQEHTVNVTEDTRIVAGLKNPAGLSDLSVGDRIRGRLFENTDNAKIIEALRRGADLYMKIRTFVPKAELVRLSSTIVPTTLQVKILPTASLRANDVNNLLGTEGTLVTVNVTEDTRLVRKYFGKTTLAEFAPGDTLHIVGRVNDDGTVDAKLIKNESIWQTNLFGHVGTVTEINTSENYFVMSWYPIRYLPQEKLRVRIQERLETYQAESIGQGQVQNLSQKIRERISKLTDKIKNTVNKVRNRVVKRVETQRISKPGVTLDDVIDVLPTHSVKVLVNDSTVFRIGDSEEATLADLAVDDRVIVRAVRSATLDTLTAQQVTVLPGLPEIDENLDALIDDINEVVEELVGSDTDATSTENETEELVETE